MKYTFTSVGFNFVRLLKLKQYAKNSCCHDKWGHENVTVFYGTSVTCTETENRLQKFIIVNCEPFSQAALTSCSEKRETNFRKPFSFSFWKQGVGWHFFSTNLCLYVWCNADRFSCTRIRLFQSLKKSQLVTCIRVFNSDIVRNTERYESVPIARKNLKRPSK